MFKVLKLLRALASAQGTASSFTSLGVMGPVVGVVVALINNFAFDGQEVITEGTVREITTAGQEVINKVTFIWIAVTGIIGRYRAKRVIQVSTVPMSAAVVAALLLVPAIDVGQAKASQDKNSYLFVLERVVDADTYKGEVKPWPNMSLHVTVRLAGVDTPEKFRPSRACPKHERALSAKAQDIVEAEFAAAERLEIMHIKKGKFAGRIIASVFAVHSDGVRVSIAERLLKTPYAVAYKGRGAKQDWCQVHL